MNGAIVVVWFSAALLLVVGLWISVAMAIKDCRDLKKLDQLALRVSTDASWIFPHDKAEELKMLRKCGCPACAALLAKWSNEAHQKAREVLNGKS